MSRIVVKFGTGILSGNEAGLSLDRKQFERLAAELSELNAQGHQVIIVSSGAIAAGVPILSLTARPTDLPGKQACAAAGQPVLMRLYDHYFKKHERHTAQLLLTYGDLDSQKRRTNAKNTLERLLQTPNVVPIINENDSVAVEELRFGDNDRLSAEVAILADADLLVLLTSADGLLQNGVRVPEVTHIDEAFQWVTPDKGEFSVGGMQTKLEAVRLALENEIPVVIADGRKPAQIAAALAGADAGTRFVIGKSREVSA